VTAKTSTTTTRRTADERRDEIVAAALHAFAAGGYAGTSTDSIARAVGVSQPYLFQLFGTKRGLFLAVVRHCFGRVRLAFEEAVRRGPGDGITCSNLDLMAGAYMEMLADRDMLRGQLQAYAACGEREIRDVVREEFAAVHATARRLSGASEEELHHFFAEGMLLNVGAILELGETQKPWSLGMLLQPSQARSAEDATAGGAD
jgi:AcrR family transcriptional regulator